MKYSPIFISGAALALASSLCAQTSTTWEGDVNTNMNTAGNWSNGGLGRSVEAVFDDPSAVANQPEVPTGASNNRAELNQLVFNQAGWTITTDGDTHVAVWNTSGLQSITSNGAGTNFIGGLRTVGATPVTTGAGNTLIIDTAPSSTLNFSTKSGAGAMVVNAAMAVFPELAGGSIYVNNDITNNNSGFRRDILSGSTVGGVGAIQQTNGGAGYFFQSGATFAPGNRGVNDTGADTFTAYMDRDDGFRDNPYTLETGSTMAIELFGAGDSDSLLLTGTSTASNVNLTIESGVTLALTGTVVAGSTYTILTAEAAGTFSGLFDSVTYEGALLTEGVDYTLSSTAHAAFDAGSGGIDITLNIPEPQTYALFAGLAGLAVIALKKRRS